MGQTILYVEKDTDLMRSTFVSYGLAALLESLGDAQQRTARIQDRGGAYVVSVDADVNELLAYVEANGLPSLLPAIYKPFSAKEKSLLEAGKTSEGDILRRYVPVGFRGDVVDYGAEKSRAEQARQAGREKAVRVEGDALQADPNYPVWAHLCSYFNRGSAMRVGYPLVIHSWHAHQGESAPALLDMILRLYSDFPADIDGAAQHWSKEIKPELDYADFERFGWMGKEASITAASIVSPTTAKGTFTVTGAKTLNDDSPVTLWIEIYLAFVGMYYMGMPFRSGSDVLLYYPIPHNITYRVAADIVRRFRNDGDAQALYNLSGILQRAKTDALAENKFYQNMLRHLRENDDLDIDEVDMISGLVGYYYKDLSGHIPFDEVTFAVPGWLPAHPTFDQIEIAIRLLEVHFKIIYSIRGDHAEELVIINDYRRFVTQGKPEDWVQFAIHYGQFRFKKQVEAGRLPMLTLPVFESTLIGIAPEGEIMKGQDRQDYSEIINNPGFRNIAQAIFECTTDLRYWKDVRKKNIPFKVRHGLGDDLRRHAHNADQFVEDLTDFVHDYQRESSNVQANTGETRQWITDEDLNQVLGLVSKYGSRVVASLLVASGYANRPRQSAE